MKCRFLTGKYLLACKAEGKVYMPSSFEIQEYCNSKRHKICPLYFKAKTEEPGFQSADSSAFYSEARR